MSRKMTLDDNFRSVEPLPCGCVPGFFPCPEAQGLWAKAMNAYDRKSYDEYNREKRKYDEHREKIDPEAT